MQLIRSSWKGFKANLNDRGGNDQKVEAEDVDAASKYMSLAANRKDTDNKTEDKNENPLVANPTHANADKEDDAQKQPRASKASAAEHLNNEEDAVRAMAESKKGNTRLRASNPQRWFKRERQGPPPPRQEEQAQAQETKLAQSPCGGAGEHDISATTAPATTTTATTIATEQARDDVEDARGAGKQSILENEELLGIQGVEIGHEIDQEEEDEGGDDDDDEILEEKQSSTVEEEQAARGLVIADEPVLLSFSCGEDTHATASVDGDTRESNNQAKYLPFFGKQMGENVQSALERVFASLGHPVNEQTSARSSLASPAANNADANVCRNFDDGESAMGTLTAVNEGAGACGPMGVPAIPDFNDGGDLNSDRLAELWARSTILSIMYPALFNPQEQQDPKSVSPAVIHSVQSKASSTKQENFDAAQRYLKSMSSNEKNDRPNLNPDIEAEVWIQSMMVPVVARLMAMGRGVMDDTIVYPTCGLCNDPLAPHELEKNNRRKRFPCCVARRKKHAHDFNVCNACLLILTFPSSPGTRVGRCPLCTSWIRLHTYEAREPIVNNVLVSIEVEVKRVTTSGRCGCCREVKKNLVDRDVICDSCFLARKQPLWYTCQDCGRGQRIPPPLYRYQASATKYSSTSWWCDGMCQSPTRWKIQANQVMLIPIRDAPWQKEWQKEAQLRVQMVRQLVLKQGSEDSASGGCSIL